QQSRAFMAWPFARNRTIPYQGWDCPALTTIGPSATIADELNPERASTAARNHRTRISIVSVESVSTDQTTLPDRARARVAPSAGWTDTLVPLSFLLLLSVILLKIEPRFT